MSPVEVRHGTSPVILGLPHTGTDVPADIWERLNDNGRLLADTDWHIHTLYDGLLPDATTVRATFHRYVIDANRDPSGAEPLSRPEHHRARCRSPISTTSRSGRTAQEPDEADIAARLAAFHAPYHAALAAEIERVKAEHGVAILYDCHSIRSVMPFLFEGTLPDFNIGTNDGKTCAPAIETATRRCLRGRDGLHHVVNGRFKGGWTTRHYGRPGDGVHAIQMELAQATHLDNRGAALRL